jgi:hypothetical protein
VDSDIPSISFVILVTVQGVTEQLKFELDVLSFALRRAMTIKDNKSFMRTQAKTFRSSQFMEWMSNHAARALFGLFLCVIRSLLGVSGSLLWDLKSCGEGSLRHTFSTALSI